MALDVELKIRGQTELDAEVPGAQRASLTANAANIGTLDYSQLRNKPRIEDVELVGNRTMSEFGWDIATAHDIDTAFILG